MELKRFLPAPVRSVLRNIVYFGGDTLDLLSGRRDSLTPPRRLRRQVGPLGDTDFYRRVGEEFVGYFKTLCALKPSESVLDIGCGCGRMAVPLTRYLNKDGSYEGFDIVPMAIEWCSRNITPRYPNFRFRVADLANTAYNPRGKYQASEYKFPYANEAFDFAYATSLFTHMFPKDMENYLSEISRVLKKGGRCFITFLLLNDESLQHIRNGTSTLDFKHDFGTHRIIDLDAPEDAVSYDEGLIVSLYKKYGLRIHQPVCYGSWCGRSRFTSYQDIVIASKE